MKQKALEKLSHELEEITNDLEKEINSKQKTIEEQVKINAKKQATVLIRYIMKRCLESDALCLDVIQEHKSWKRCMNYVTGKAKEFAFRQGGCCMSYVNDETVYEWAEDYYHLDDKEAVEKELAEAAERKAKREKEAAERKAKEEKRKAKDVAKRKKAALEENKQKTSESKEDEPSDDVVDEKCSDLSVEKNDYDQLSLFENMEGM